MKVYCPSGRGVLPYSANCLRFFERPHDFSLAAGRSFLALAAFSLTLLTSGLQYGVPSNWTEWLFSIGPAVLSSSLFYLRDQPESESITEIQSHFGLTGMCTLRSWQSETPAAFWLAMAETVGDGREGRYLDGDLVDRRLEEAFVLVRELLPLFDIKVLARNVDEAITASAS